MVDMALVLCPYNEHNWAAAGLFVYAFPAEPKLTDDLQAQHRYNAACASALAAAGNGVDAGKLDDKERTRLRQQALNWLRADPAAYTRLVEKGDQNIFPAIHQRLAHCQQDTTLSIFHNAHPP